MKWFLNLTTRGKLFVGFGLMIGFLAIVIATAYRGITSIQASQRALYEQDSANALDLLTLRNQLNAGRAALCSMMLVTQPPDREAWHQEVQDRRKQVAECVQRLLERNRHDPLLIARIEELRSLEETLAQVREDQIIPLINAGQTEQAKALVFGAQKERNDRIRVMADELGEAAIAKAEASVAESELRARAAVRFFVVVGVLAMLLAVVMALFVSRVIALPLQAVSGVAEQVASGDLTAGVPKYDRADEVGALVGAFRAMIEKLRRATQELHEGVGVLASSSSEILATTTQVASSMNETATAVSQTTATVEEVKQTAQVASQKARHVSDSAQKASQVSQAGRRCVEDTIEGMHRVQEQMQSIADSVVRLSEQGQAIGQIIASVNDLAEQSNLLAVNAAIEASKAGEQGKGFAVVAQEIKALAEQSKQATAQVRAILGDIQKATAAAVMATEQGHKAVQAGVQQSAEAGESIRLLADSVAEAAQAATQIAASSQQQMVGMDQVALAMENIKQASAQNVAGTKQAEAAAQGLHELGMKLKSLIANRAA
jgi:methyl-accepting chemotaxis protein